MTQTHVGIKGTTYEIVQSSPVIEADGSKGRKFWRGHVVKDAQGKFYTCSESWKDTTKGVSKTIWSQPYYATPTNVGRSNETTNADQAYFEFSSMVKKQRDKREADKPLPMLANTFIHYTDPDKTREHKIIYPCAVQRKYDGNRMLTDGDEAWSRGNKVVLPEVLAHIFPLDTMGRTVDGELLLPGNQSVNKVTSAIKKFHKGISDTLYYVIYDIVDERLTFLERIKVVQAIVDAANNPNIIMAETLIAKTKDDVLKYHEGFVAEGYEGSIIRNLRGVYKINKRTDDVQKHKDWITEEFMVDDIIEAGGGSSEGIGKAVCRDNQSDATFESTLTGSEKERREILANKHKYIGKKWAVVKFRERSGKHKVPFHSNVLEFRDTQHGGH